MKHVPPALQRGGLRDPDAELAANEVDKGPTDTE
jgi:hypothetical protein